MLFLRTVRPLDRDGSADTQGRFDPLVRLNSKGGGSALGGGRFGPGMRAVRPGGGIGRRAAPVRFPKQL